MTYREFIEQDNYCKTNNVPEGKGCLGCPAENQEHCADELRGLFGKLTDKSLPDEIKNQILKQIDKDFGIGSFSRLASLRGDVEFGW